MSCSMNEKKQTSLQRVLFLAIEEKLDLWFLDYQLLSSDLHLKNV